MPSEIPIRNIYYLLCYAWDKLDATGLIQIGAEDRPETVNLIARILIGGLRYILKSGLDRGYELVGEDTSSLRGRIHINQSIKRQLFVHAKAHCFFDELSNNIPHNQILKATGKLLLRIKQLDTELHTELTQLIGRLNCIEDITLTGSVFRRVQLHRNNAFYGFLLNVCELAFLSSLPLEGGSGHRFRDFLRDRESMARLFQAFVYNFYRLRQKTYRVTSEIIEWDAVSHDPESAALLPIMRTDISLRSSAKSIVIDTKYYLEALKSQYAAPKVNSLNLYQIFSYVKNLEVNGGLDKTAEGILLYPTVAKKLDQRYYVQGHTIRVCTIDLAQDWHKVEADLLTLIA